ncbi:hypothetical protein SNOG_12272 [Parastagonospora nodorum SN15]|uniref:Uncharacterized protein n=1 Tax=Phaeosphaeria nodorum (strain SN15 / ATCC MYA-4574 / FGSC 10173) TaxID=321614 RepID=Q0U7J2_PHANO|nr:hypothetical protein SNOG_12272 [Parastagonospora nodorum SN15]EAT80085.1 hypothetical protein SNOG_12272 [Parastagonospora nodorum SN15]
MIVGLLIHHDAMRIRARSPYVIITAIIVGGYARIWVATVSDYGIVKRPHQAPQKPMRRPLYPLASRFRQRMRQFPTAHIPALLSEFSHIPASALNCWDAHANYSTSSSFLSKQIWDAVAVSYSAYPPGYVSLSTYMNSYYNCSTKALPTLITLLCSQLKDAYSWRVTHLQSQVPMQTGSILAPGCSVLNAPAPDATPRCYLEGGSWEASYWPSALPTNSALCSVNETTITATPTRTAQPVTAIVSGFILTSPSVYNFVRNAALQTFIGCASFIGDPESLGDDVFAPSTTASLLTVRQLEGDIVTISHSCAGSGKGRYCTWRASAGYFSVVDLATVRANEYCRPYGCYESETILQDEYTPTAALAMTDIVTQNGVYTDCAWTTPGRRVRTAGPAA